MRGKFFLLIALFFCLSIGYAVEELPVSVRGDQVIYNDNIIVASGNALITYNNYEINADNIIINTSSNIISGSGHVFVAQESGQGLSGEEFQFNIEDEKLELHNVVSSFKPKTSREDIFLKMQTMENKKPVEETATADILHGSGTRLTTCDLENPHYWLSAKEFIYYPNKRIVGYHVTTHFWFSPLPLAYTPYYVFYLGARRVVMKPPVVGSNTVEGDFIKTETVYFLDEYNDGSILVDAMSKKGQGLGWEHRYNFGDPGSFYFYNVLEQDTKPRRYSKIVKWRQIFTPDGLSKLAIDHRYRKTYLIPTGFDDRMDDKLQYTYNNEANKYNADYAFSEDYQNKTEAQRFSSQLTSTADVNSVAFQKDYRRTTKYRYESFKMDHLHHFNDEWSLQVNPAFRRTQSGSRAAEERLDLAMDLYLTPKEQKNFESLQIHYNWFFDTDRDRVTADNLSDEFVEKVPEITLKALRQDFFGTNTEDSLFSLNSTYTSAFIRESKYFSAYNKRRFYQTMKASGSFEFFRDLQFPELYSKARLARNYKQSFYQTQDSNYTISDLPWWETDLWSCFRNRLEYEDTRGDGNSPFFFDDPAIIATKRGLHRVTLYQRKQWETSITYSKDHGNLVYFDDLYSILVDPWENRKLFFTATSGRNHYTELYRDLSLGCSVYPSERYSFRLNLTKDINNNRDDNELAGKLKTASSELNLLLGDTYREMGYWDFWRSQWQVAVKNQYDFNTEYFNLVSFMLGKDLHCWQMKYNFTPVRKEWYIVFSLKAFPEQPLNLRGNEDQDVSFEAFQDYVNSGGVKRYE